MVIQYLHVLVRSGKFLMTVFFLAHLITEASPGWDGYVHNHQPDTASTQKKPSVIAITVLNMMFLISILLNNFSPCDYGDAAYDLMAGCTKYLLAAARTSRNKLNSTRIYPFDVLFPLYPKKDNSL